MKEIGTEKILALLQLGVPQDLVDYPVTGSMYLESVGGPSLSTYWNNNISNIEERQRDEFFLVACSSLWMAHLIDKTFHMDELRQGFDAAFLFHIKSMAQFTKSIDILTSARCYPDSLILIRALHSRVNLIVFLSLNLHLFSKWMKSPNDPIFRDVRVREELERKGIKNYPHFYKQFSEIVHDHPRALIETGYLEGVFPHIPAIGNMIFVASKLLLAVFGWIGISMVKEFWNEIKATIDEKEIENTDRLFKYIIKHVVVPNRFDHLFTVMAEERHWRKESDNTFTFSEPFDYLNYRKILAETNSASNE